MGTESISRLEFHIANHTQRSEARNKFKRTGLRALPCRGLRRKVSNLSNVVRDIKIMTEFTESTSPTRLNY